MNIRLLVILSIGTFLPLCVLAEEGANGHYVPGATADFMDTLPRNPGLAAVNSFTFYNGGAGFGQPFEFGGRLDLGVEATVYADTTGLLDGTTLRLFGGSYAVCVALPVVWIEAKARTEESGPHGPVLAHDVKDSASGLGDIALVPFILGWNQLNGDLKYDLRLSIFAPTGSYEVGHLANTGKNYWTVEPGFSVSWLSHKLGTEVSLFGGFSTSSTNQATDYHSGAVIHFDSTVAQHLPLLGGTIGLGVNAFYYQQITADSGAGAYLGPFEGDTAGVGPVLSYFRKVGKSNMVAEVKWLPELTAHNRLEGDYIWLKVGVVF
jgi:hypothetical protein